MSDNINEKTMAVLGVLLIVYTLFALGVIYVYAYPLADWIGAERAILIGIGIIIMFKGLGSKG